jgi:epoxyqueuosine reductase
LSYLTIENKGAIPEELRPKMGNWIFGCDECQQACPWNEKAGKHQNKNEILRPEPLGTQNDKSRKLSSRAPLRARDLASGHRFLKFDPDRCAPKLVDLMALDDAGFRDRFAGTPVLRAKRSGLLRNVAVALGNGCDSSAVPVLEKAARDSDPLIREHAEWARARIRTKTPNAER